ncbi:hypothetical protein AAVH_23286 [Aphelenchoides avenae]|nr:hypothetical protein AAVH_23286 [Aphelenchus avenae]
MSPKRVAASQVEEAKAVKRASTEKQKELAEKDSPARGLEEEEEDAVQTQRDAACGPDGDGDDPKAKQGADYADGDSKKKYVIETRMFLVCKDCRYKPLVVSRDPKDPDNVTVSQLLCERVIAATKALQNASYRHRYGLVGN